MERLINLAQNLIWVLTAAAALFALVACGNGGSINFQPPATGPGTINNRGAATTMVPASQALAIESGQTTATGYHAKLQLNPNKGTELTGSGYNMKLKHTTRNR